MNKSSSAVTSSLYCLEADLKATRQEKMGMFDDFAPALGMKPNGALVQLVRISACHAGGHEFEPRTHRQQNVSLKSSLLF